MDLATAIVGELFRGIACGEERGIFLGGGENRLGGGENRLGGEFDENEIAGFVDEKLLRHAIRGEEREDCCGEEELFGGDC